MRDMLLQKIVASSSSAAQIRFGFILSWMQNDVIEFSLMALSVFSLLLTYWTISASRVHVLGNHVTWVWCIETVLKKCSYIILFSSLYSLCWCWLVYPYRNRYGFLQPDSKCVTVPIPCCKQKCLHLWDPEVTTWMLMAIVVSFSLNPN